MSLERMPVVTIAAIRAFVAVPLPEEVRARLGEEVARLRPRAPGVAWVSPSNLHLTLKFLGAVESAQIQSVQAALAGVVSAHAPFQLAFHGLGAFPTVARPRVVWAGVGDGVEAAQRLAGAVERALGALGFEPDGRAFSAHVTLGRVRVPRLNSGLAEALEAGRAQAFGAMLVDRLALVQSELSPQGARYTELAVFPLG